MTNQSPKNKDQLYQAFIQTVYDGIQPLQDIQQSLLAQFKAEEICQTYGELLYPSIIKMLQKLQPEKKDVFVDLGSGIGKLALTAFINSNIHKIIGIEGVEPYSIQAQAALKRCQHLIPNFLGNRQLSFAFENFLNSDLSEATIVYCCSTCYTQSLLKKIGDKINQTPSIEKVVSLKPIDTLTRLPLYDVFSVECSWDSALAYYYKR